MALIVSDNLVRYLEKCKTLFALKTEIPSNVSELTNDSEFATKAEVDAAIAAIVDADGKEY